MVAGSSGVLSFLIHIQQEREIVDFSVLLGLITLIRTPYVWGVPKPTSVFRDMKWADGLTARLGSSVWAP